MLKSMRLSNLNPPSETKRYGSETDVSRLTGRARKTLQKDRLFGKGFPYFRCQGKILYDLAEVESIIQANRVEVKL